MKTIVFDIEADGLYDTVTMMSCCWCYCIEDDKWTEFREHEVVGLMRYLNDADVLVAHNGVDYDKPALDKITGLTLTPYIFDTLTAVRFLDPDKTGGHSLKQWGKRLGILKGELATEEEDTVEEVYGVYSEELSEYCKQDVQVTLALLNYAIKKGLDPSKLDLNPIKLRDINYD